MQLHVFENADMFLICSESLALARKTTVIAIGVLTTTANRIRLLPAYDPSWIRPAGRDPAAV